MQPTNIIQHRTELLFLYEIENANPNGDPMNENRPRFDAEDGTALVSDVRLKRTIRDYWYQYKGHNGQGDDGKDIFVREIKYNGKGKDKDTEFIQSGKQRSDQYKEYRNKVLESCIDVRVFGGVLPLKDASYTFTGPVQFQMGRTLNKTEVVTEQGTGAFASGENKKQASFRVEYKLPYALVGFNGIINEKAAEDTHMSEADRAELMEGLWEGTQNLISRSKYGQAPLLLLAVHYKHPYQIGSLRQRLTLSSQLNELALRSTNDYQVEVGQLRSALQSAAQHIDHVAVRIDGRLQLTDQGQPVAWTTGNHAPHAL